jgi:hypothetical protein
MTFHHWPCDPVKVLHVIVEVPYHEGNFPMTFNDEEASGRKDTDARKPARIGASHR